MNRIISITNKLAESKKKETPLWAKRIGRISLSAGTFITLLSTYIDAPWLAIAGASMGFLGKTITEFVS